MEKPPPILQRNDHFIIVTLIAFLVPLTLYIYRSLDDNKLTNWNWAFAGTDLLVLYGLLAAGLAAAYFLSKQGFIEHYPAVTLMTVSFVMCSLFWSEPEVIIDTSRYFTQAKHLSEYGIAFFIREWGNEINAWTDLPLLPFLYGLIFKVFGEQRIYIQVFTALLFSLAAVVTYLTGKTLWDERVGFNAGMLLAGIPYLITQTPLMLVDTATMFTLMFSLLTFIKAMEKGGIWVPISSAAFMAAVFSKYSTWMMLSVLGIAFLVYLIQGAGKGTKGSIRIVRRALCVSLIAAIPVAVIAAYKFEVIAEQINLLVTYQKPGLKGWSESFLSTFFFQTHPLITVAALVSLYAAFRKRDIRAVIISWLPLLMVLLWVRRSRYVLPVFPMLTLMAAYGFQAVKDSVLRRYLVFAVVSTSLVIAFVVYLPFLEKMSPVNFMHAGAYLDSLDARTVEVFTLPSESFTINPAVSVPVLDLFTGKKICFIYAETGLPDDARTSPLRFTWTYKNPEYYKNSCDGDLSENRPLVIITSEQEENLTETVKERVKNYRMTAEFNTTSGIFRYSPALMIYER